MPRRRARAAGLGGAAGVATRRHGATRRPTPWGASPPSRLPRRRRRRVVLDRAAPPPRRRGGRRRRAAAELGAPQGIAYPRRPHRRSMPPAAVVPTGDERAVKQALRLCCDLSDAWAPSKAGFDVALDVWKALPPPAELELRLGGGRRAVGAPAARRDGRARCDDREAALPPGRDDDARALALRALVSELSRLSVASAASSTSKLRMRATGVQRVSDPGGEPSGAARRRSSWPRRWRRPRRRRSRARAAAAVTQLTGLADVGATPPPAEGIFAAVVEAHLTLLSLAQSHGGCAADRAARERAQSRAICPQRRHRGRRRRR